MRDWIKTAARWCISPSPPLAEFVFYTVVGLALVTVALRLGIPA